MRSVFFLRTCRIFNKGRYSRSRQTTRVVFFLSLAIHNLVILGIFSLHYSVLLKLGVLWWPSFLFFFSFFFTAGLTYIRSGLLSEVFKASKATFTRYFLK